jgi:uncharacterized protein (DUF302 family)
MKIQLTAALAALLLAAPATAQEYITYTSQDDFDDTLFTVESAILDQGLVIDLTSHTGDMLERTRADVGSDIVLYQHAEIFSFCSARLSRKVMEVDPMNIVHCPYRIFVMQQGADDQVLVGFKTMPPGEMQEVQEFLATIVTNALE